MTDASTQGTGHSGTLPLTWVTGQLERALHRSQNGEPPGTWTGLGCPSHGLEVGADVDNTTLQHLATGQVAALITASPAGTTGGQVSGLAGSGYQPTAPRGHEQLQMDPAAAQHLSKGGN